MTDALLLGAEKALAALFMVKPGMARAQVYLRQDGVGAGSHLKNVR